MGEVTPWDNYEYDYIYLQVWEGECNVTNDQIYGDALYYDKSFSANPNQPNDPSDAPLKAYCATANFRTKTIGGETLDPKGCYEVRFKVVSYTILGYIREISGEFKKLSGTC